MADERNGSEVAGRAKERSPNYPALTLTEAIGLANSLWTKEKRTSVSPEVAARAFDYKSLSGPARQTLATLRQYGLLESDTHGVRLSDLAMEIIHHPAASEERTKAVREAALKPPLIRDLSATHAGASDDALRAFLITRKKFSEDGARRFIRAFRDALALANLSASGYTDSNMMNSSESGSGATTMDGMQGTRQTPGKPRVTLFSWPLSRGVTAEVRFVGEEVTPAHLERLRQYLDLAKDAVASDESETGQ